MRDGDVDGDFPAGAGGGISLLGREMREGRTACEGRDCGS